MIWTMVPENTNTENLMSHSSKQADTKKKKKRWRQTSIARSRCFLTSSCWKAAPDAPCGRQTGLQVLVRPPLPRLVPIQLWTSPSDWHPAFRPSPSLPLSLCTSSTCCPTRFLPSPLPSPGQDPSLFHPVMFHSLHGRDLGGILPSDRAGGGVAGLR